MENLKKISRRIYIETTLILVVAISSIDSIFDTYVFSDKPQFNFTLGFILYIIAHIVVFLLCAWFFWKRMKNNIEEEQEKQKKEIRILFADMAHDLKTPLTSVIGFSKILKERPNISDDDKNEYITIITEKAEKCNDTLNMMLDYARYDSPELKLDKVNIDASEILRRAAADQYHTFEEKGIFPELEFSRDEIIISADPTHLRRALSNLISNAILHSGNNPKVRIKVDKNGIYISDTGKMIPQKEFDSLLKPFVIVDDSRKDGSTGLGLSCADTIVKKHGFHLALEKGDEIYTKTISVRWK